MASATLEECATARAAPQGRDDLRLDLRHGVAEGGLPSPLPGGDVVHSGTAAFTVGDDGGPRHRRPHRGVPARTPTRLRGRGDDTSAGVRPPKWRRADGPIAVRTSAVNPNGEPGRAQKVPRHPAAALRVSPRRRWLAEPLGHEAHQAVELLGQLRIEVLGVIADRSADLRSAQIRRRLVEVGPAVRRCGRPRGCGMSRSRSRRRSWRRQEPPRPPAPPHPTRALARIIRVAAITRTPRKYVPSFTRRRTVSYSP